MLLTDSLCVFMFSVLSLCLWLLGTPRARDANGIPNTDHKVWFSQYNPVNRIQFCYLADPGLFYIRFFRMSIMLAGR